MDRRRYTPSPLGPDLETRVLLTAYVRHPDANIQPTSFAERIEHINHLPLILQSYQAHRAVPASVLAPIQSDLRAVIDTLQNPPVSVLNEFNHTIRFAKPRHGLSGQNAQSLINAFDAVNRAAGISPALGAKFSTDMTALAKLDVGGPEPTIQAINDFALISQLTLVVGQPFPAPVAPALLPADRIHKLDVTPKSEPRFDGIGVPGTDIRIIDANTGAFIGQGYVPTTGRYVVQAGAPLADGTHVVRAQTEDSGFLGQVSRAYSFRVVTIVPKGPRHH